MIIWSGRGFIVAVITFGSLVLTEFFTRAQFHDDNYYQHHGWPKLVAFLVSALFVWLLLPSPEEVVRVDLLKNSPKRTLFRPKDSLFFMPVRYWPGALLLLGVVFYFVRG
jgi:hypothetical protein